MATLLDKYIFDVGRKRDRFAEWYLFSLSKQKAPYAQLLLLEYTPFLQTYLC